jgi:hypothetical protein
LQKAIKRNYCQMGSIKKYQKAILEILEEFAATPFSNSPTVEKQIIADLKRNRFQVIGFGWEKEDILAYSTFLHFEIKNGKIWIQQNWTEILVATELVERGISKSDIVLGFVPEYARDATGYAVA